MGYRSGGLLVCNAPALGNIKYVRLAHMFPERMGMPGVTSPTMMQDHEHFDGAKMALPVSVIHTVSRTLRSASGTRKSRSNPDMMLSIPPNPNDLQ